ADVAGHVQALVACPPSYHAPPSSLFSDINWEALEGASEFPEIRNDAGWNPDTELRVGLKWQTKEQLNRVLRDYSIRRHQTFKVVQSDPLRLVVKCPAAFPTASIFISGVLSLSDTTTSYRSSW
ncbi:hypothetical protein PIB30_034874, partial [Stylosanthes scabra]|nr:hypothetical protein [Stylosanthes scabra]